MNIRQTLIWRGHSIATLMLVGLMVSIAVIVIASYAADPLLRTRIERDMNLNMRGHRASLGHAHLSVGGVLSLKNLTIIQIAHSSPPLVHLADLHISILWCDLLRGQIAVDCIVGPTDIQLNLAQLRTEAAGNVYFLPPGWRNTLRHLHPFTINSLRALDTNITYTDSVSARPMRIEHAHFTANRIRNIDLPNEKFPSPITVEATIFDLGHAAISGNADLLGTPLPSLSIRYELARIPLAALAPALGHFNLTITGGRFASDGNVELSPEIERFEVAHAIMDHLNLQYTHRMSTAVVERSHIEAVSRALARVSNMPDLDLTIHQASLRDGTIAYRDEMASPAYRLYMSALTLYAFDFSNWSSQKLSTLTLDGLFMGSGKTSLVGRFRPRQHGPDFDLNFAMANTYLPSLNDMLHRYGRIEVQSGTFSVYSQAAVRDGQITGYMKPLITDLKVHKTGIEKAKSVYPLAVNGAAKLLRNPSTKAVATKIDLLGKLDKPEIGTLQALLQLVRNAFIKAIVPGFDQQEQLVSG